MEFTRHQIKTPVSLGQILKKVRLKKNLTLDQAEEETKVRSRYLKALEDGRYELLPTTVYAAGFVAKYADFLGLSKNKMVELYNQERGINTTRKNYTHDKIMVERRIKEPFFSITPRFMMVAGIVLVLGAIFAYIAFSVRQFTSPPNLEISSPSADQVIKEDKVEIIGKTDEGSTIMINGQNVFIDDYGNFHQEVKLQPGLNTFEIRSINQLKKENVKLVKVLAEINVAPIDIAPTVSPSAEISPEVSPTVSPSAIPSAKKQTNTKQ